MSNNHMPIVHRSDVFRFARFYWSKKKVYGALAFAFLGASLVADVFFPVLTGRLIDLLVTHNPSAEGSLQTAIQAFLVLVILQVFSSCCWTIAFWYWNKYAVHNLYRILTDGLRKVQRFSLDWHINAFAGATVRKITRGMWSFDVFEDTIFMGYFPAIVISTGMTIMLIIQVPIVGLFLLPMILIFVAVTVGMAVKINMPRFKKSAQADTAVGATIADIMTAIPTVKAFAGENREDEHFAEVAQDWRQRASHAWLVGTLVDFVRQQMRNIMMVGMIGLTIYLWSTGQASPGDVALSITSFFIISGYLRDIGRQTTELLRSVSEMEDIISFWKRVDEIQDAPDAKTLQIKRPQGHGAEIEFNHVHFAYKSGERDIYKDMSVHIKAGEKIALVGASGSGKSTFVKLIQRFYDIQSGEILIDGQNIAKVTQESLRQKIALVPQEPILFHRSLADNIAYGRPLATHEDIKRAAHEAFAAEFIERLSHGYDTLVGERGVKLSGGERQRIAIARALLADCPILILDEATSSLDSVSEHYIQQALTTLMQGRTTITIAHRLATIQKADRILVFDHGRIIEQGTHHDLLKNSDSAYRRLYDMQALDLVGE
jgi:ATP-binding cassette subfamily B protein